MLGPCGADGGGSDLDSREEWGWLMGQWRGRRERWRRRQRARLFESADARVDGRQMLGIVPPFIRGIQEETEVNIYGPALGLGIFFLVLD